MTLPSPMKNIVQTTESLMSSVLTVWFLIGSMIMVLMHGTEGKQREPTECNQHGDGCWDNKSFIPQKCLAIFLEIMVCVPGLYDSHVLYVLQSCTQQHVKLNNF